MKRFLSVCIIGSLVSVLSFAACTQGQGGRCQVNEDCKSNLICNVATNTCQSKGGGQFDASIIDAAPADAAVDTMTDGAPADVPGGG